MRAILIFSVLCFVSVLAAQEPAAVKMDIFHRTANPTIDRVLADIVDVQITEK